MLVLRKQRSIIKYRFTDMSNLWTLGLPRNCSLGEKRGHFAVPQNMSHRK